MIYVKLEERQQTQDPWVRERWQRDQIMRALVDCSPDDVIMISDCDEIMPGEMVETVIKDLKQQKVVGFIQTLCAFCLNRHRTECYEYEWQGSACTYYDNLQTTTPSKLRELVHSIPDETVYWKKGGWHFSYIGGLQRNIEKCNNFAHCNDTEEDYDPEYEEWRAHINTFTLVPIDETYPQYVQDNIDYFIDVGLVDPY